MQSKNGCAGPLTPRPRKDLSLATAARWLLLLVLLLVQSAAWADFIVPGFKHGAVYTRALNKGTSID